MEEFAENNVYCSLFLANYKTNHNTLRTSIIAFLQTSNLDKLSKNNLYISTGFLNTRRIILRVNEYIIFFKTKLMLRIGITKLY